jgi:uncharacterized protein
MQIIQRYNIHIDVCHSFKGVWLDRGEIDKIGRIQSAHIEEDDNKNHYKKSVCHEDDYEHDNYYS